MFYEQVKELAAEEFKRLTGVKAETFAVLADSNNLFREVATTMLITRECTGMVVGILKDYRTKGRRCYRRVSVQFSQIYTVT